MMRAIVIRESLVEGAIPELLASRSFDKYPHLLDGEQKIQILEFDVGEHELFDLLGLLAGSLREPGYYAHVWSPRVLYVCFPGTIALVRRHHQADFERAKRIGGAFGVPHSQMRFEEMFDTHHPDTLQR